MGVINLNLYQHPSGVAFCSEKVKQRMKELFPEGTFPPGDRALAEARRAEALFADELRNDPRSPAQSIVNSLYRKARNYGPAYTFSIPREEGQPITGTVRNVGVTFLFEDPLRDEIRIRLIAFLRSLGFGQLEASKEGQKNFELLADLSGPSDCLRDDGRVPWLEPMSAEPVASEAG